MLAHNAVEESRLSIIVVFCSQQPSLDCGHADGLCVRNSAILLGHPEQAFHLLVLRIHIQDVCCWRELELGDRQIVNIHLPKISKACFPIVDVQLEIPNIKISSHSLHLITFY